MLKSSRSLLLIPFLMFLSMGSLASNAPRLVPKNYGVYKSDNRISSPSLKKLTGHVLSALHTSKVVGPVNPDKVIKFSLSLTLNKEDELDQFLADLYDPNSVSFHKFLTSDEFSERYAPSLEQVEQVRQFLESNGIEFLAASENRAIIHGSGKVRDLNSAFHTELRSYVSSKNVKYFAPAFELQIPDSLPIQSVLGLENLNKRRHYHLENKKAGPKSGFTPANIHSAYSLGNTLTGAGQVVAVYEFAGYTASDITAYEDFFGLPHVALENVLVDGYSGKPGNSGDASEVTLDIELLAAMVPGAKILVYEAPNDSSSGVDMLNKIASDNLAKAISCSWGDAENQAGTSTIQAEAVPLKQMAAQGQAFLSASGDNGAYDDAATLSVDDPGSQPYAISVGGTSLAINSNGAWRGETTWVGGSGPSGYGGGGGISSVWTIPSWQTPAITPASKGSTTMRNVPDISVDAVGYAIYFKGKWRVYDGTSCSAPIWTGLIALINQERVQKGLGIIGYANPEIYASALSPSYSSTFHDIVGGTNLYYPAVKGFDDATGWGSFFGDLLISVLSQR